jgi:hypothetical protein
VDCPLGRLGSSQCGPRAPAGSGPAKFRQTGGQHRPGASGGRPAGSLGSISGLALGRGAAGVPARRSRAVATVGAPAPARLRRGQDNTCAVKLECDVGKVLEALAGDGGERREELCCGGAQGMRRRLMARGGRLSGAGAREGRPWVAL